MKVTHPITGYRLIMAGLRSRCGQYIFALWFLSFYLSLPAALRAAQRAGI